MDPAFKEKLKNLKQGHHACFFYDTFETSYEITVEFIKIGLERNERCLYLSNPLMVNAVTALLEKEIDLKKEIERGAVILTSERSHLVDGQFNRENMIQFLENGIDEAVKAGFTGLRATGDVIWELGSDVDMGKMADYEIVLDRFFPGKKLTGLCQYNCEVVQVNYLRQSLLSHNAVVFKGTVSLDNLYHGFSILDKSHSFEDMLNTLK